MKAHNCAAVHQDSKWLVMTFSKFIFLMHIFSKTIIVGINKKLKSVELCDTKWREARVVNQSVNHVIF